MPRLTAPALVLALAAASVLPARAEDWPQFRGPRRDDVSTETGLLRSWPADGPELVWKGEGVGRDGFSSVAVAGQRVYTMGDKEGASYVFALDRRTGKVLWEQKVGRPGGNYRGTRCTPTVDGALLYALGQYGDLVCLETATGEVKWRKNLPKDFGGRSGGWNYTESPLVDGDRLVCTPGGAKSTIVALDKRTGEVVWRSALNQSAGYSSIVISEAAGVRQYVQLLSGGTVGVRASDGKLLWKYGKFAGNTANIPTPIVLGNQVFTLAGYGGGGGALLTLKPDGKGGVTFDVEYFNAELKNKHGGAVVVGDYVYADTDDRGQVYCANWKTGEVKWKGRSKRGGGSASVTYADGHLYVHYANGWVALVEASPAGYRERGLFKIPNSTSNSWAHPVVSGGKLYLRDKDVVWCYEVKGR